MKVAEISPVFKKLDNTNTCKHNYRSVGTLSNFTKLFENIIYSQVNDYTDSRSINTSLPFETALTKHPLKNDPILEGQVKKWVKCWSNNNGHIKSF